jgi:hypothetical protein
MRQRDTRVSRFTVLFHGETMKFPARVRGPATVPAKGVQLLENRG